MAKLRLGLQLKEAIKGGDSANKNQYLMEMSEKFDIFREDLRSLVESLQAQSMASKQFTQTRMRVMNRFAKLAEQSPIAANVGSVNVAETTDVEQAMQDVEERPCFLYIYRAAYLHRSVYDETFSSFIVEFAAQWERDVVGSVTKALEQSEELRREVDHYQAKVQSLQNERPSLFSKSKEPDPKDVEKLARNKGKLADSRALYESHVQELCSVIEEVTDRGWKNMLPILVKLGQSDQTLALNEHKCMSHLEAVAAAVKNVGYGSAMSTGADDATDVTSLPSLKEDMTSDEPSAAPPLSEPSSPLPALPTLPPPTAPPEMPPDLPSEIPSSSPSETDPEVEKMSEGVVDVTLEDKSDPPMSEASMQSSGDEKPVEAHSEETKSHDVGTSFSPRSYMY